MNSWFAHNIMSTYFKIYALQGIVKVNPFVLNVYTLIINCIMKTTLYLKYTLFIKRETK